MLVGLLSYGGCASDSAPALGPPEKYFDPQPAALVRAALANDVGHARALVAAGVNPNSQGPRSDDKNTRQVTLLSFAVGQRSEPALRLLIQAGADPLFKPRKGDGNAFGFAISRNDTVMLDALYRAWPMSNVPAATQSDLAVAALRFSCSGCLQTMFKNGLSSGTTDSRGYNLFMEALSREDLETAEWLLKDIGVPFDSQTIRGVNSANHLQSDLAKYRPGTPTHDTLLRMQEIMKSRGVVFPVETSAQWRARHGIE